MARERGRGLFFAGSILLVLTGLVHSISLFQTMVPKNQTERC